MNERQKYLVLFGDDQAWQHKRLEDFTIEDAIQAHMDGYYCILKNGKHWFGIESMHQIKQRQKFGIEEVPHV